MKNLKLVVFGVLVSIFMLNCSATKYNTTEANLNKDWMMVSFQNFSKDILTASKAHINLEKQPKNPDQYAAKMGCNQMFFTMKTLPMNKIEFSAVGSTMMYCEGQMELESAFGKALPMMTQYKIDGHYLTLSDGNGHEMKFVATDWD